MEKNKKFNGFTPRCDGFVQDSQDFDKYYINRKVVQVVKKTGEGETDFILEDKVIDEKILIDEVIQADADSCGVYNIINKVLKTGDESILNIDNSGQFADISAYPDNIHDAYKVLNDAVNAYENRGDILQDKSMSELSNISAEQLQALIDEAVQKQIALQQEKEKKGD